VDPRLELVRAIDFGMLRPAVTPLLLALKWINGFVGNYGWSIIALTVIINVLIFPLRHRSMVSMRKMQALQPQVKAIQERYAKYKVTDPERQKMNQEMMALYKQKGVNPASGCLPMLLTMPILFAFYAMLSAAIELRGAPFMGWIVDLSRHDPLYITPVMMGLSMLLQQRMMPTTADPIQQKLFLMMPVIFTASFLWAPAGLVLYLFSSNLMAIGQQYITNRTIGMPPAPARAAAKAR
jgi:YidC/Oxa1 family membrane protein insertase